MSIDVNLRGLFRILVTSIFFVGGASISHAQSILVKPRGAQSLSYSGTLSDSLTKKAFRSQEEYHQYVQNLPSDQEWEPIFNFSADDVSLPPTGPSEGPIADPYLANQWSIYTSVSGGNSYGGVDIDAVRAWSVSRGSEDVVVYVMDSGVDTRDPDLQGRVTSGFDAYRQGQSPIDENGHGTHVASIIGAIGDNNYGITGVVPGAIQLADGRFLNAQNQGDSQAALRVLEWIEQDMRARREVNPAVRFIVSNSWGGEQRSSFLESAMQRLAAYDALPVTSAGNHGGNNDSRPYFPCNFRVIANTCVASSDRLDLKSSFSGFGPQSVHLLAPGDPIYAIVPGQMSGSVYTSRYETKRGTSQAVPHVSGVAALVWAANPNLSATEVRQILVSSVDRLPGADAEVLSGGRLNAYRAVLIATGQDPNKANRVLNNSARLSGGGCELKPGETSPVAMIGIILFISFFIGSMIRMRRHANEISQ